MRQVKWLPVIWSALVVWPKVSAWAFKMSARALGQVRARLACLLLSNRHCYYSMQRRTHMKHRRAECPLKVLQEYTRLSKTTSTITSKSFGNFRRHFLKINFRYNVRLTLTATVISGKTNIISSAEMPWEPQIWCNRNDCTFRNSASSIQGQCHSPTSSKGLAKQANLWQLVKQSIVNSVLHDCNC